MFQIGDKIIYGGTGVCEVEDITHLQMEGIDKNQLYYLLIPMNEKKRKIYTPTDNEKVKMRKILTKEEAEQLVDKIAEIEQLDAFVNDKQREEKYKATIKDCDCREWIKMIKTLYRKKKDLVAKGKKLSHTDEKYLRQVEDTLYGELSVALNIDKDGMVQYLEERVQEK